MAGATVLPAASACAESPPLSACRFEAAGTGKVRAVVDGRSFTLEWSELKEWVGQRSQAGRVAPKGFPRSNKFGPQFR